MWEIAVVIAVAFFAVTCVYLIKTLITLQRSLKFVQSQIENLNSEGIHTLRAMESRVALFDPLLRSLSNIGDVCEYKTNQLKNCYLKKSSSSAEENGDLSKELMEWALLSAHLGQKFLKRR